MYVYEFLLYVLEWVYKHNYFEENLLSTIPW